MLTSQSTSSSNIRAEERPSSTTVMDVVDVAPESNDGVDGKEGGKGDVKTMAPVRAFLYAELWAGSLNAQRYKYKERLVEA